MNTSSKHPLADLVPDYLNGQLSDEQADLVREALRTDPQFRELVEFDARLRNAISETSPDTLAPPDQMQFERQLRSRSAPTGTKLGLALAATALLAIVIVIAIPSPGSDDYQTLTDAPKALDNDVIRITFDNSVSIETLLETYDLELVKLYPSLGAADVRARSAADVLELRDTLLDDERLRVLDSP